MSQDPKLIERYTATERTNHWFTALCFVLLALSGLALFHPAFFWLTNLFGGGTWTRILHPFVGVVMFLAFCGLVCRMFKHNLITEADKQWLCKIRDVVANREENLPEVGRYNAGQKVLFFVLIVCMIGLLLSGIVIWRVYFSIYFPVGLVRAASVLHALCAFGMIVAIVVHVYAAIWVKGSFGAMIRGKVTPGWAWKHHRLWFREVRK